MTLLILYVALALGISFLCSVFEAVILSVTPSFIALRQREGARSARLLKRLKQDVDRPLAAILTLNTIAHTVGAAGAGAQAAVVFGAAWVGVASAVLTLLILVLSEILPKTLGAVFWRELAAPVSWGVQGLVVGLWPFVQLSRGITWLIAREKTAGGPSREELLAMAEVTAHHGELDRRESEIVENLLSMESLRVRDVLTPRHVVAALPADMPVSEAFPALRDIPFSRIPIYEGEEAENITAFVLRADVMEAVAGDRFDTPLSELRRPLPVVHESMALARFFELLLGRRAHIAAVVDEYGALEGIATLEDALESLLGREIVDERDEVADMRAEARRRLRRLARRHSPG